MLTVVPLTFWWKMTNKMLCMLVALIGKTQTRRQLHQICYLLGYGDDWCNGSSGPSSQMLNNMLYVLTDSGLLIETYQNPGCSYELTPRGRDYLNVACFNGWDTINAAYLRRLMAAPLDELELAAKIKWEAGPLLPAALELLNV